MKRVTGIGGIFFSALVLFALGDWYLNHLGIDVQNWGSQVGTSFDWAAADGNPTTGTTVWSVHPVGASNLAGGRGAGVVGGRGAGGGARRGAGRGGGGGGRGGAGGAGGG